MRKVYKPKQPPDDLLVIQQEIEQQLLEKKERFDWEGAHYSKPIKKELSDLYHDKCAYCESKLTSLDTEEQYTIEHYRPKQGELAYWWLGNEWTNLFPLCKRCNNKKGSNFPIRYGMKRVKQPLLLPDGGLDRTTCRADQAPLINEQPEYLHPEIDDPLNFFSYNVNGEMYAKEGLREWDKSRATLMLKNALNDSYIVEKRKKYLEAIRADLEQTLNSFYEVVETDEPTDRELRLGFNPFFKKLYAATAHKKEFSTLAKQMYNDIDAFLLVPLSMKLKEDITAYRDVMERALLLFLESQVSND